MYVLESITITPSWPPNLPKPCAPMLSLTTPYDKGSAARFQRDWILGPHASPSPAMQPQTRLSEAFPVPNHHGSDDLYGRSNDEEPPEKEHRAPIRNALRRAALEIARNTWTTHVSPGQRPFVGKPRGHPRCSRDRVDALGFEVARDLLFAIKTPD
jgi:hypothetical protein